MHDESSICSFIQCYPLSSLDNGSIEAILQFLAVFVSVLVSGELYRIPSLAQYALDTALSSPPRSGGGGVHSVVASSSLFALAHY